MKKIFISHRGSDSQLAERLATDLRNKGHDVWLDIWELKVGDSIIEKINKGLTNCEVFILCYSQQGIESPWISREWMSTLAQKLEGSGVSFYPIKISDGEPPTILADYKYIDFSASWSNGLDTLYEVL